MQKRKFLTIGACVAAFVGVIIAYFCITMNTAPKSTLTCGAASENNALKMSEIYRFGYTSHEFDSLELEIDAIALSDEMKAIWDEYIENYSANMPPINKGGVTTENERRDSEYVYATIYTFDLETVTEENMVKFGLVELISYAKEHTIEEAKDHFESIGSDEGVSCKIK